MNLKLLLVLIVLCLTAGCGRSVKDDSHASALVVLETSVARDLKPRYLPSGKEYCAELSRTEQAQDECLGDLEDVVYQSNRDKARGLQTLQRGLERLRLSLTPCKWHQLGCKRRAKALDQP